MSRLLHRSFLWVEFLEILSFLTINDVYRCCGCLNRSGFVAFLRERAIRNCPRESASPSRFLCTGLNHQKVLLVSYPRSGNSFLRRLMESSLGIVTGSDSRTNRPLSESLLRCGFKGEGIVDDSVWMVKSHYPERMGYLKFRVRRIVLLIRNPFDAMESYFHMGMTNTHDKNLSSKAFNSVAHLWPAFVANEIAVWTRFHQFWMTASQHLSVFPVRYEDLLADKLGTLDAITNFMKGGPSPLGIQRFSPHYARSEASKGVPGYKPKGGAVGKSLRLLGASALDNIEAEAGSILRAFGYKICEAKQHTQTHTHTRTQATHSFAVESSLHSDPIQGTAVQVQVPYTSEFASEEAIRSADLAGMSSKEIEASCIGTSSNRNCDSDGANCEIKIFNTDDARTLEILPWPVRTPDEWAKEFQIMMESNLYRGASSTAHEISPQYGKECSSEIKQCSHEEIIIPGLGPETESPKSILINEKFSVRLTDDLFGRRFTEIRHLYTADDENPLEVQIR